MKQLSFLRRRESMSPVEASLQRDSRIQKWEPLVWLLAFAAPLVLPNHALLMSEMAITALFAMSLDLILGYTGIVSLGHAAFFGMGAYSAALFAKLVMPDPLVGLLVATLLATLLGGACSLTVLRGSDLTRLMVTLGVGLILLELANKLDWLTGGADGLQGVSIAPVLGLFEFDLGGKTAAWYSLAVTALLFLLMRRWVHSPFGASLKAVRDNRLRAASIGINVNRRIAIIYTMAAGVAGAAGALMAQTTGFASLDVFAFDRSADLMLMLVIGGTGWLWGGIAGAVIFKLLHTVISNLTPQYWTFWIGLFLVVLVLVGRERLMRPWTWFSKPVRTKSAEVPPVEAPATKASTSSARTEGRAT
ncbi:MAG: branched-chain amino acid ABC transporter permease [Cytophagales bacterium]|nr:branched-chain amino acid ABC transporter permease [Cytophagales bacterium]